MPNKLFIHETIIYRAKNKDDIVRLLTVNKAKTGQLISLGRAHGSRDAFVSLSNGRYGLYFIFTAQTDVKSCKGSARLFQALRITYTVCYFVGFLPLLRVGLSGLFIRVKIRKPAFSW